MHKTIHAASFCLLLLLAACGSDETKPVGESAPKALSVTGFQEGDPDKRLVNSGLGKEDFALIEAELQCVEKAFTGDAGVKAAAAIIEKWLTTEEWVQGVRAHVDAEKQFGEKVQGAMDRHAEKVCPSGVPTAAFLTELGIEAPATPASPEAGDVSPETEPTTDAPN